MLWKSNEVKIWEIIFFRFCMILIWELFSFPVHIAKNFLAQLWITKLIMKAPLKVFFAYWMKWFIANGSFFEISGRAFFSALSEKYDKECCFIDEMMKLHNFWIEFGKFIEKLITRQSFAKLSRSSSGQKIAKNNKIEEAEPLEEFSRRLCSEWFL